MNIAITTWHSGPNAGTFFQLYGLYKYLENRGQHVEVINYTPVSKDFISRGWYYYFSQPLSLLKKKIERKKYAQNIANAEAPFKNQLQIRSGRFQEMYNLMNFTEKVESDEDFDKLNDRFDAFVVGSDQIWNASMLNRRYFLNYVHPGKIKAAYCPSMGSGTVLKRQREVLKHYLKDFNYISTRELKLKQILTPLLQRPVEHLLDPSMLYPREEYLKMAHLPEQFKAEKYLLCYFLPNNDFQAEQARKFAKERGLKLVIMAMHPYSFTVKGAEIYAAAGPKEFVGLIANAAVVFSSSFHCTIFSIMLHKDLYIFEQSFTNNIANINQRYTEQLETYGMTHRYIRWGKEISKENEAPIDYENAEKIFQERLRRSYAFLNQFS